MSYSSEVECRDLMARIKQLEAVAKCDCCDKPFDENGGICEPCHSSAIAQHIKPLGSRIRELEAERSELIESIRQMRNEAYEQGKYAIEAATIERCAQEADWFSNVIRYDYADVAKRIRALKPSGEEGKSTDMPVDMPI